MSNDIIVAIIAMVGTALGTFGGIMTANKLTNYRIEQLEKTVNKHNNVIQKTFVLEEQMKVANHRIADLEDKDER